MRCLMYLPNFFRRDGRLRRVDRELLQRAEGIVMKLALERSAGDPLTAPFGK